MKTRKIFGGLLVLVLLALLLELGIGFSTTAVAKETIKLKIGSGHPLAAFWIKFVSNFYCKEAVKRVRERTNYHLELAEFWGGSVAKLGEELESVEIGILDLGAVIVPFEPTKLFLHNYAFSIPFFSGDPRVTTRVNDRLYKTLPVLKSELKKYNQVYLGSSTSDDYGLNLTFPVRKAEDVKGHKIAAAGPNLPWISGVGAVPVQGTLNEFYTAGQTGVYDGWVMYAVGVVSFKLHEVARHFIEMNFGAPSGTIMVTINAKVWDKLPPEVRAILQEVGDEYGIKYAETLLEERMRCMKVMRDARVDIYQMPFEEKAKWAKLLVNMPKKFAKEADSKGWPGTEFMRTIVKFTEEEGHVFPRKWMEE